MSTFPRVIRVQTLIFMLLAGISLAGPLQTVAAGATAPPSESGVCETCSRQSPINIIRTTTVPRTLPPLEVHYGVRHAKVWDTGHDIQVDITQGGSTALVVGGRTYQLVQFHFHGCGEHQIGGVAAPMELHFVHADQGGELTVVGVMMQRGAGNPIIGRIIQALDTGRPEIELDPADLLPSDRSYFGYAGSLTTPPYTEGVRWHLLHRSIELSQAQIDWFRRRYLNCRLPQNLNGRVVLDQEAAP